MEQFGYLITDVCSNTEFLYIHNALFENMTDCIQSVFLRNQIEGSKRVLYFKILQNAEIVKTIHEDVELYEACGFCHLKRSTPNEKFLVFQ